MTLIFKKEIDAYRLWRRSVFMISFLEILLLVVVSGLFVVTAVVSFASTKGAASLTALKNYLAGLQPRLVYPATIDPETERESMEVLLNGLKVTCGQAAITENQELRTEFGKTYEKIKIGSEQQVGDRSSWVKFREVTRGFNEFYFPVEKGMPLRK